MNGQDGGFSILDALAVISFMIGLANFDKNIAQLERQEAVNSAVLDIHSHIQDQDRKLDAILKLLGGDDNQ